MKIVEAKALELGRHVVLHVDRDGNAKAAAIPDAGRWETPMVALLSQQRPRLADKDEFYLSYPPTEACHGFRLIRSLMKDGTKIIYRAGNHAVRIFKQINSPGPGGYVDGNPPVDDDLPIAQPRPGQNLVDWLNELGGHRGQISQLPQSRRRTWINDMYTGALREFNRPIRTSPTPATDFFAHLPGGTSTASAGFADLAFIKLAYALVHSRWTNNRVLPEGNNVAAVLVDSTNALVGWSVNCKEENGCFHAETAILLRYLNENDVQHLPAGFKLYTSLEPCHMCAGMIAHYGRGTQVFFGQKDPNVANNSLARQAGGHGSTQERCVNRRSEALERAYRDNHQTQAIAFLNSTAARNVYQGLRSDLSWMNRGLDELSTPQLVSTRSTSSSVFGRLNLDVPDSYVRNRQGPPVYGAIRVRGADVTQETALLNRCATLLENLVTGGLITRPANLLDL